jgi:hypothetical protein
MEELQIEVPKYTGESPLTDEKLNDLKKKMKIDPEFEKMSKYGQFMDVPPPKPLLSEVLKFNKNALKKVDSEN